MKTNMKKLTAYLLALLLVFQVMPVFAESYSGTYAPGNVQYRENLEIVSGTEGKDIPSIMAVNEEFQLSCTEGYEDIEWVSSNTEIATVAENGRIKGIAAGQVKITVYAEKRQYEDSITIRIVGGNNPEKEETESEENIIIVINCGKNKVNYNGEVQTNTYTISSNSAIDESKVRLIAEDKLAQGTDCNTYTDKLSAEDFVYDGDETVEFVVSNGWLKIRPLDITVKADDVEVAEGEEPVFTATITGLLEGDDPDSIQYTFEVYTAGDVTYIIPECESIQGNYRIKTEPGVLVIENGVYRAIKLTSDWPAGEPAYAGTMITMTAELVGFENVDYTLQWQYSVDGKEWFNEPGANGATFTFELNETTVQYYWRVVANY